MVLLGSTGNATRDFSKFYASGGWRGDQKARDGSLAPVASTRPMSGQGSKLDSNGVSCGVLSTAVRIVASRRAAKKSGGSEEEANVVRIVDTPCGDFTWMPWCLDRIAQEQPNVRLKCTPLPAPVDLRTLCDS